MGKNETMRKSSRRASISSQRKRSSLQNSNIDRDKKPGQSSPKPISSRRKTFNDSNLGKEKKPLGLSSSQNIPSSPELQQKDKNTKKSFNLHNPSTPPSNRKHNGRRNFESPNDKENISKTKLTESPRVTSYWEVSESGRKVSPRLTRSARKRRLSLDSLGGCHEDTLSSDHNTGPLCLTFSPPDHKKNEEREKKETKEKEEARLDRLQRARNNGQLLIFSPSNQQTNDGKDGKKSKNNDETGWENNKKNLRDEASNKRRNSAPTNKTAQKKPKVVDEAERLKSPNHKSNQKEMNDTLLHAKELEKSNTTLLGDIKKYRDINAKLVEENKNIREESHYNEKKMQEEIEKVTNDLKLSKMNEAVSNQIIDRGREGEKTKEIEQQLEQKERELAIATNKISDAKMDGKIQNAKLAETVRKLEENLKVVTNENERLKKLNTLDIERYMKKVEEDDHIIQTMENVIKNKENELSKIEIEKKSMLRQLQSHSHEFKLKEEKILILNREIEQMKLDKSETEKEILIKAAENQTLKKLIENLNKKVKEKDAEIELSNCDMKDSKKYEEELSEWKRMVQDLEKKLHEVSECNKANEEQLSSLSSTLTNATKSYKDEKDKNRKLTEQLRDQKKSCEKDHKIQSSLHKDLHKAETYICKLQRENKELDKNMKNVIAERDSMLTHVSTFDKKEEELNRRLRIIDEIRRELHNKVMRLSGNIKVFVRVRPLIGNELEPSMSPSKSSRNKSLGSTRSSLKETPSSPVFFNKHATQTMTSVFSFPKICDRSLTPSSGSSQHSSQDICKSLVQITEPYKDRGGLSPRRQLWSFGFDGVFTPSHNQMDIWLSCEPMIQSAIDGHNVCIFAYGQTGSGKTYTMLGKPNCSEEQGLIMRAVTKIFAAKEELEISTRGDMVVNIGIELLEIYNDKARDLLHPSAGKNNASEEVEVKVRANGSINNIVLQAESEQDVLEVLDLACKRRRVKATKCNTESSRSHLLFSIQFSAEHSSNPRLSRKCKLNICDLAGSERLSKNSNCENDLLKEAQHINTSLSALSNVIESLQQKKSHVPYRDSKLTHLLKDSLGGDSKTLAIVCCNPVPMNFHESICSLRFAEKMNRVELKQQQGKK